MWLKRFLLFLVFIFNAFYAQNKPFSLFYALDETYVNPAAMGKMRAFEGSVFYRHFFSGFNRAPNDQGLALRLPVKNLLFGINYLRNQNAQEQHNEIAIDFGYRINFSENELNMMSLGIAPIFELISFYPIDPLLKDQNDPAFAYETTRHFFKANVRIGLSYFWKNLQIGFSVPYFLSNYTQNSEEKGSLKSSFDIKKTQLFFNGQYFLDLKKIGLSFVLNQRLNLFYNTDFMVMAHIKNLIGIVVYYSTLDKLGLLIYANAIDFLRLSYNFNIGFSKYYNVSGGFHEIGLLFKIPEEKLIKLKNSRFTN